MLRYYRLWRFYSIRSHPFFHLLILSILIGLLWSIFSVLTYDEDDGIEVEPSPLIFCFVLTANNRHLTSARSIVYSWGKRCDRFYFVTRLQNTSVELMMLEYFQNITDITSDTVTAHTFRVLSYLEKEELFLNYQWFLRGSDDSYVIAPNLRRLVNELHKKIKKQPLVYVGDVEKIYQRYQIQTSGSVMLFNRQALTRLVMSDEDEDDTMFQEKQECLNKMIYDHEFVNCMKRFGIRINPLNDDLILSQNLSTYKMDKRFKGFCCSPYTVAFRSNNETDMYKFDFLYHRLDALSKINT